MHRTMFCPEGSSRRQINTFMLANDGSSHGGHNSIDVCLAFFQLDGIVNFTWVCDLIVYRCHGSLSSQAVRLSVVQSVR